MFSSVFRMMVFVSVKNENEHSVIDQSLVKGKGSRHYVVERLKANSSQHQY